MHMICGVGLDLIEIERVRRAWARFGDRFARRVLSDAEWASMHGDPAAFLAGRLAAKEAVFKALGTGWAEGVTWRDVEVLNAPSGAPEIRLRGVAQRRCAERGASGAHLSLSHTREHAAAVVVIEAPAERASREHPSGGKVG
jgi:holo-[acyl-carrier protein] synthase